MGSLHKFPKCQVGLQPVKLTDGEAWGAFFPACCTFQVFLHEALCGLLWRSQVLTMTWQRKLWLTIFMEHLPFT